MAKNTKALSGPAKRKYFRDALQADPGVTPEATKRLTEKFDGEVSQMRVRQHKALPAKSSKERQQAASPATPAMPERGTPAITPEGPSFDPHAFSLIVVMTKQGAAGLQARLDGIDNIDHLKALARAQHVAIDDAAQTTAEVRAAIIAGTAQRIADRRAAAS